jgi:hypothetical protein
MAFPSRLQSSYSEPPLQKSAPTSNFSLASDPVPVFESGVGRKSDSDPEGCLTERYDPANSNTASLCKSGF